MIAIVGGLEPRANFDVSLPFQGRRRRPLVGRELNGRNIIVSIFDRIKRAILGEALADQQHVGSTSAPSGQTAAVAGTAQSGPSVSRGNPAPSPVSTQHTMPSAGQIASPVSSREHASAGATPTTSRQAVDIAPILDAAVTKSGQKLDWKHSIVDLMKAVGMDASLDERKELAHELGYSGDAHDSARMNTFLHKALMKKLSENGGTVPADFVD